MTNAQQCEAKQCGELFYTEPLKVPRCKRSRVWVEDMAECKLGLWKREVPEPPPLLEAPPSAAAGVGLQSMEIALGLAPCISRQYQRHCGADGGSCWCLARGLRVIPWDGEGPSPCTMDCEHFEPRTDEGE